MKTIFSILFSCVAALTLHAQLETDKPIVLTGSDGERYVTGLELPVNAVDAANKAYVDAAVSGSGGGPQLTTLGDGSLPTRMSAESPSTMNYMAAIDYCRNLEESTYTDWRIPSLDEVHFLRANDATYPNIPSPTSTNEFWIYALPTMPAVTNGTGVRALVMSFGNSTFIAYVTTNPYRARCVR